MKRKKKVVLVYYALLHYRKSLFDYISDEENIDFKIICGKKSQFENSKYYESSKGNVIMVKNIFFKLFGSLFYIQSPVVYKIFRQRPDVVILRGVNPQIISMLYAFIMLKLFSWNTKIYWWGHGTTGHQGKIGVQLRKFFYKFSNGTLLQGKKGIDILTQIGIKKEKLHVIGNNMNNSSLGYRHSKLEENISNGTIRLVFIGRLVQEKRVDLLLEAVKLLKNEGHKIHCSIIGEGSESDALIKQAQRLQIEQEIEFTGALYDEQLSPYFSKANITVIPDYSGLSIIHGLSYGLPFITSDDFAFHGPEIEVLDEQVNGTVYPKNDINALKNQILWWHDKLKTSNGVAQDCINSIHEYTAEFVGNNIIDVLLERK